MQIKDTFDRKAHWEKIYTTKQPNEVSWHQDVPATSLQLIQELNLPKSARIFDNGAGDSFLVDQLLKLGYKDVTVQDISGAALNRVKDRLAEESKNVCWVVDDEAHCQPDGKYDVWHDRAAFHFLIDENEIESYVQIIERSIKPGGTFIVATFSTEGPKKCSGLPVCQYSETSMEKLLLRSFNKVKCMTQDHTTPFNTTQNFLFCVFRKR